MKSKASAPGKVILFGEHFVVYGIKAVLCAIDKRVTVTAETISEEKIVIESDIGKLETSPGMPIEKIDSILRPIYYLANKMIQNKKTGIRIVISSEIPPGTGLGSSSACCVAGAGAIAGLFGKHSKEKILELAIEAEKTVYEKTSGADCTICTYGGIMQYAKKGGFVRIFDKPNFHLVIANSNIEHSTELEVRKVSQFKEKNEEIFLKLCHNESSLIEKVLRLFQDDNIIELGETMNQNQKFLEAIGVSNKKIDEMVNIGQESSFGSKITGAGGGGCVIALTDNSNLRDTTKQFRKQGHDCFSANIDYRGLDTF